MGHADALAARAARNEARGDNSITWVDGREYKLKPELYFDAIEAWGTSDRATFVKLVLADPSEAADFLAAIDLQFGWLDLNVVWDLMLTGNGTPAPNGEQGDPGESSASSRSSKKGSKRSRPTSNASTDST